MMNDVLNGMRWKDCLQQKGHDSNDDTDNDSI